MENTRIFSEEVSIRLENIWRKNAPQIYKLCCKRSSTKEAADDLFQEVALKFCKYAKNLNLDTALWPWFYRVTLCTHFDLYRREKMVLPFSVLRENQAAYDVYPEQSSVHFRNESRENKAAALLKTFMQVLDPEEALVTELTYLGGFLLKDAARILTRNRGYLSKLRCRAVNKMRKEKRQRDAILEKIDAPMVLLEDLLTRNNEIS